MNKTTSAIKYDHSKAQSRKGFSLQEIIVVMAISSMVVITALSIFNRVQKTAGKINDKLEFKDVSKEVLQRIARDLDRLAVPGADTTVKLENKAMPTGYDTTRLTIENKIYDRDSKPQVYEKIVWQTVYDEMELCLNLYRSHSGINLEDRILDISLGEKQADGTELFVPVAFGLTLFEIAVPRQEEDPLKSWTAKSLPPAVQVSLAFEEMENPDGTIEILEEYITGRTIAIDRTRKISFKFIKKDFTPDDPNDFIDDSTDPNELANTDESDIETDTETEDDTDQPAESKPDTK